VNVLSILGVGEVGLVLDTFNTNVYGDVPPLGTILILPSLKPLHDTFTHDAVSDCNKVGSVIVTSYEFSQ
jgi:hypothetical protein